MAHRVYCKSEATRNHHNAKAKLHDKLQVSNGEIQSTRKCVNLVTYTNFTALCVTETEF